MIGGINREFTYTESDFNYLSKIVGEYAGINLTEAKRELLYSRLTKRLRKLGISSFAQYCELLKQGDQTEFTHFINAITTNVTSFFRENHHFDFLSQKLVQQIVMKKGGQLQPRLRIWSAGCSSGEEPYSIAIVLKENISDLKRWDAKILATDLDSNMLDTARRGIYPLERLGNMSGSRRERWFKIGNGIHEGMVKISDEIKKVVTYRRLNLASDWPMHGPFDAIFCRNVMIYFDKPTRIKLINRFADILTEDGCLFIGHSESMLGISDRFYSIGKTIHRRIV